jgi:hypothetical protein
MIILLKSSITLQNQKKVTQGTTSSRYTTERSCQVQSEVGVLNQGGSLLLGITGVMVTEASCPSYNYIAFTSSSASKHFVKCFIGATLKQ